eukprot:27678_1
MLIINGMICQKLAGEMFIVTNRVHILKEKWTDKIKDFTEVKVGFLCKMPGADDITQYSYEYIDNLCTDYQIVYLNLKSFSTVIEQKLNASDINKIADENKKEEKISENNMSFMKSFVSGTKFIHKSPLDENGILCFLGTHGTRDINKYQNPATFGMVT